MSKTYLFFDIECANCFDNEGKICSFGYALCDEDFNLIENKDLIINPNAEFDPYLFQKNSSCKLAYPKSEFLNHDDFNAFYEPIKNLLTAPNCTVAGFGVDNDVEFLVSECLRYKFDIIDFKAFDIHNLVVKKINKTGGLDSWIDYFKIDRELLQMHRSSDDALATMLVAKKLCENLNCSLDELFAMATGSVSSADAFESFKKSLYKNLIKARIEKYMKEPCKELESDVLKNKTFYILMNKKTDLNVRCQIIHDIVLNGGKVTDECVDSTIILSPNPREKPEWLKKNRNRIMYFDDVYDLMKKRIPRLYLQQDISTDFDVKKARKELNKLRSANKK